MGANHKDQRRYPRIHPSREMAEQVGALGAEFTWPNDEISAVFDLSYKGLAVRRPGVFPFAVQQTVAGQLRLGANPPFDVQVRVAWFNLESVGFEIKSLPPEGHQAMAQYLDAQLRGASLRPVESAFFAPMADFHYWWQGASDTHVFVWTDGHRSVQHVSVQMGDVTVHFDRGQKLALLTPDARRALLLLSQVPQSELAMNEFLRTLNS